MTCAYSVLKNRVAQSRPPSDEQDVNDPYENTAAFYARGVVSWRWKCLRGELSLREMISKSLAKQ